MGNINKCGIAKHNDMRAELMGPDEDECLDAARDYLMRVREELTQSVKECFRSGIPEAERSSKLANLRKRWHPDKNPVLKELAGEVTKLLNDEVAKCELRRQDDAMRRKQGSSLRQSQSNSCASLARGSTAHADYVRDASFEDYAVVA